MFTIKIIKKIRKCFIRIFQLIHKRPICKRLISIDFFAMFLLDKNYLRSSLSFLNYSEKIGCNGHCQSVADEFSFL